MVGGEWEVKLETATIGILLGCLAGTLVIAATNTPPETVSLSTKVTANVTVLRVLKPDMEITLPDGKNKKQYFEIVDRHVLTYSVNGKQFVVTNDMPTGNLVLKRIHVLDDVNAPSVLQRQ
jgi:hypothetical protein